MNPDQKRLITHVMLLFAFVLVAGLAITLMDDTEARLCVWDGGDAASALASDPDNWDTDTAPVAGDDILFDGLHLVNASADDPCTWDLATNSFDTFTIAAGYSGTITQSSDMYISGYSQAGGVFTGVKTKWIYCSGDAIKSGGTISNYGSFKLELTKYLANYSLGYINTIVVKNGLTLKGNIVVTSASVFDGEIIGSPSVVLITSSTGNKHYLNGIFNNGLIQFNDVGNVPLTTYFNGTFNAPVLFRLESWKTSSVVMPLVGDIVTNNTFTIDSTHSTYTLSLNLNGHSLTASSITVGTRGILQCGEGTITTSALTSTSGTITEETATWIFTNATVTATSGEKFYNVYMNGWCDFVSPVNVTHDLRFINVPTEYQDIDIYLDTVYSQTISSPYSWGDGNTVGAKYEYEPDVQITMSQFYEDIDFSIYAYISTNLPVTYNITGTASDWLSIYEGRVVGMPPELGNYTFTITATHDSGSVDIVNGYILVGSLSTAEYSFDMIWELIIWIIITLFMLLGWYMEIPLIQLVAFAVGVGNIINTLRIDNFTALSLIFILGNSILFLMGMIKYSQGRR